MLVEGWVELMQRLPARLYAPGLTRRSGEETLLQLSFLLALPMLAVAAAETLKLGS